MKEDYVSCEVAKLLKEKGFMYPTRMVYDIDMEDPPRKDLQYCVWNKYHGVAACPSQAHVMKWLREKYNILITIRWVYDNGNTKVRYGYNIYQLFPLPYKEYSNGVVWFISYDNAIEVALKYTLENLI